MLKPFIELYNLDVKDHIKERVVTGKVTTEYIPWMDVVVLLHKNGAESVKYGNIYAEDGHSLFMKGGKCPEVHVFVEIDGDRREASYPVIKGSFAIKPDNMDQLQVSNATQRAFVKCVATNWGLGLKVWQKEELEAEKNAPKDLSEHSIFAIRDRLNQLASSRYQMGYSTEELCKKIGVTVDIFTAVKSYFPIIDQIEEGLKAIGPKRREDDYIA
ncbi:MAG: DUF1071 domain-containing protein [Oscillospiraceae bacterium]|nr:DUF1071 domain-containing protein [Oscillospiraceae bacterium]